MNTKPLYIKYHPLHLWPSSYGFDFIINQTLEEGHGKIMLKSLILKDFTG